MKKTVLAIGTVAVVTLSGTIFGGTVHAEPSLQDKKTEKHEISSKLSAVESNIKEILLDIQKVHQEVVELENKVTANQKLIKDAENKIDEYEAEIDEIEKRIEERNEILKTRIASYQEVGGNVKFLEVLLGARDFSELISRISAVTTLTNSDFELIEEQEADMKKVETKIGEQEDVRNDLIEIKETLKTNLNDKKKAENVVAQKEKDLKAEKANLESDLQSVNSEIASLEEQIRAEMAAAAAATATASNNNASNGNNDANTATNNGDNGNNNANNSNNGNSEGNGNTETTVAAGNNGSSNNNSNSNSGSSNNTTNNTSSTPKVSAAPSGGGGGGVIDKAMSQIGTPYKSAGKGPGGFDCSGFVSWAYGGSIPSYTGSLKQMGQSVGTDGMQPGDLVFFDTVGEDTHVGIYVGGGNFIASNSSNGVEVKSLSGPYWKDTFKGHVRRVK